jgi:hypothetical protein
MGWVAPEEAKSSGALASSGQQMDDPHYGTGSAWIICVLSFAFETGPHFASGKILQDSAVSVQPSEL